MPKVANRPHGAALDASGAAETNRDLVAFDDDRHGAPAAAVGEHALKLGGVLLDVDVLERDVPPLIIGPGGLRVGSGVLAEDVDHGAHCKTAASRGAAIPGACAWRRAARSNAPRRDRTQPSPSCRSR